MEIAASIPRPTAKIDIFIIVPQETQEEGFNPTSEAFESIFWSDLLVESNLLGCFDEALEFFLGSFPLLFGGITPPLAEIEPPDNPEELTGALPPKNQRYIQGVLK